MALSLTELQAKNESGVEEVECARTKTGTVAAWQVHVAGNRKLR